MVAEKSGPSFNSILTILSIVMYTGGFLRIEVEFNKQKDKINELEKVVDAKLKIPFFLSKLAILNGIYIR